MAKARVAILEDDSTLATALKAAFEKSGYEVYTSHQASEILEYLEKNSVATVFVDCLLPDGSGVDFVESIRSKFPPTVLDVVMMSGIFTDAGAIKDVMRSTKATHFLKKPFDLAEALKCIQVKNIAPVKEEMSPRKKLYLLLQKEKVTVREKRKAIEALEEIHGFDLPYLYSLLVETMAKGHLNIIGEKGEVFGISFSDGKIVAVDIVDTETQLGKLLIEAGYIQPDDLKDALSVKSSKKIGEKLIQGNLLSPHAFDIALANQMTIRISRTIVDGPVKVNFVATDVELTTPFIDSDAFAVFLHDWIAGKISAAWLKAHYTQWGSYTLAKSASFQDQHHVLKMPLIAHLPGFVNLITQGQTLNQIFESKKYPEETALKGLHLLLSKGLVVFGQQEIIQDPAEKLKFLKRMSAQLQNKNQLEIWDLLVSIAGGSTSEPAMVVSEFKKILGPLPPPSQAELTKLHKELTRFAEEAQKFGQSGNRDKMKEEIARQEIQNKMKASSHFEEGRQALYKSLYPQAISMLEKASSIDPSLDKGKLHLIWAKLGLMETKGVNPGTLREIEMDLMTVPPEEKFEALYSFVMGLMSKYKGDDASAKKSFEKAYNLDNNLLAARREIASLAGKAQKKDIYNADLKDLVSGFFKKR